MKEVKMEAVALTIAVTCILWTLRLTIDLYLFWWKELKEFRTNKKLENQCPHCQRYIS